MFSCFFTNSFYQDLGQRLQRGSNHILDVLQEFSEVISEDINELLCSLGCLNRPALEHIGVIARVEPLAPEVPEEYVGKCYHAIDLTDGARFELIFDHIDFEQIAPRLKRGYMVKIFYDIPYFQVINLYPVPYYRTMAFEDFLDLTDVDNQQPVRVCYFEGQLKKVEILAEEEDSEISSESTSMISVTDQSQSDS